MEGAMSVYQQINNDFNGTTDQIIRLLVEFNQCNENIMNQTSEMKNNTNINVELIHQLAIEIEELMGSIRSKYEQ